MQFGEPLLKAGYRAINVDRPSEGSQPLYETQTIDLGVTYPENITIENNRYALDRHGVILDGPHEGESWREAVNFDAEPRHQREHTLGEEVPATQEIRQLTGWELEDGTVQDVGYLDAEGNIVEKHLAIEADFTGMGDTDLARKQWEFEQETSPEKTQFLLDQMKQFGPEFTEQARALVERSDPTGFAARELLGNLAQEYAPAEVPEAPTLQETGAVEPSERIGAPPSLAEVAYTPEYERAGEFGDLRRVGEAPTFAEIDTYGPNLERAAAMNQLERSQAAPSLERLEDIPELTADPESLAGRRYAEQQLIGRAQSGRAGDLMAEEASRLARGRQAASGNIFGGGAVLKEARAVRQAEDAGQRQGISDLLGFLSSGQTAGDYESRLAQQNLMNKLMGIEQRTGAEQSEFGMGQQVLSQQNQATMQERADELAALGQRNQAEQQEFNNLQTSLAQINQTRGAQLGADIQAAGFDNQAALVERADQLGAMAQRNQAEESEFQSLLQGLGQQQGARTAGFGMQQQAIGQRNQAADTDFARQQAALGQQNQARQQSFANAMQRTATQQQMQQQQMANLQSFSGLAPVSGQFGGLGGAQQAGAMNFNPIQYTPTSGMQLLQGQQGLAGKVFGTQADIWGQQAQAAAQPSGFGSLLGTVGGAYAGTEKGAGQIGSALGTVFGFLKCHTARLVFGEDNPEWLRFYLWKEHNAPKWFRSLYNKYTERVASWLKDKPRLQSIVRNWMRRKFNG